MNNYLLSHFSYGSRSFRIDARIRFNPSPQANGVRAMNGGIVFGWVTSGNVLRYYHLMFTGTAMLLELIGSKGGPVFRDFIHVDEGVSFSVETGRYYRVQLSIGAPKSGLNVDIDGKYIYSAVLLADCVVGRVGLRPWRSTIESDTFTVGSS